MQNTYKLHRTFFKKSGAFKTTYHLNVGLQNHSLFTSECSRFYLTDFLKLTCKRPIFHIPSISHNCDLFVK